MKTTEGKVLSDVDFDRVPRVIFVSHALHPSYDSSRLIQLRMAECGRNWPKHGEDQGHIRWLSFPVVPPDNAGRIIRVDFEIIPVWAKYYLGSLRDGWAYMWATKAVEDAVALARAQGVPAGEIYVGWGAYTKLATNHGMLFMQDNPKYWGVVNTTHGDAGASAFVAEAVERAGFKPGFKVAIIGANGAIGDAVSRQLTTLGPSSIMLVGRQDETGTPNLVRLEDLKERVVKAAKDHGRSVEVVVHQHKEVACLEHDSDLIIVATSGDVRVLPHEVPAGALLLDVTTPSACGTDAKGWGRNLVIQAGCGRFADSALPIGFGHIQGAPYWDVGAGGSHVLWGCAGETIIRAVFGWKGHLLGPSIPLEAVEWCTKYFRAVGYHAQPPRSFGREISWEREVRQFVRARRALAAS